MRRSRSLSPLAFLVLLAMPHVLAAQDDEWQPDRTELRRLGGADTEKPLRAGLGWLALHQSEDGHWGSASFVERCESHRGKPCDMVGAPQYDVGDTALSLLALSGVGGTRTAGPFHDAIQRAANWLVDRQTDDGCIGSQSSHDFLYGHLVATLALAHVFGPGADEDELHVLQRAVDFILKGQTPGGGWRYEVPSIGGNDTSITVWALTALCAAGEAGCRVPDSALFGVLTWIESCTVGGLTGYDGPNTTSARTPANVTYEPELGEALTAAALWARHLLGVASSEEPNEAMIARVLATLPVFDRKRDANDMYYWYYGSYAMFQTGGRAWKQWNDAFKSAAIAMQSSSGGEDGSWDPIGPWGYAGGRVYATAIQCLSLEVYYRYPRFEEAPPSAWRAHAVASIGSIPAISADAPEFIGSMDVHVTSRSAGAEIRYTLDGSDPTPDSPLANGKITIRDTSTVRAAGFVGGERVDPIVARRFTKVEPIAAVAAPRSKKKRQQVRVELFELGEAGLPDFDALPLSSTFTQGSLATPKRASITRCGVRLSGFLYFPETGVYSFSVGRRGPIRLTVGGASVVESTDERSTDARTGRAPLEKGWHRFELAWSNFSSVIQPDLTAGLVGEERVAFERDRLAYE